MTLYVIIRKYIKYGKIQQMTILQYFHLSVFIFVRYY